MHKFWSLLFAVVILAELGLFAVSPAMGWWLPKNVATHGPDVDFLFYVILYVTGFFFVVTEGVLVYNMWKFSGDPNLKPTYTHGNHKLEIAWTIVPAGILLFVAFSQINAWEKIKYQSRMPVPGNVMEVSARQFEWRIRYPSPERFQQLMASGDVNQRANRFSIDPHADDLWVVNEVHTWKGADTRVYLRTRDVLHSFFLPQLRVKQDAVPGKTIPVWFNPTEANVDANGKETETWELACAELCGWGHYKMQGRVYVHPTKEAFVAWLERAKKETQATQP